MKLEKIIISIALLGILMKFFHIPFAGPILVVSLGTLALLYFPLGFYILRNEGANKKSGLLNVAGLLFAIIVIGILYKLMYWPFAGQMLLSGVFGLVILFAVLLFIQKFSPSSGIEKEENLHYKNALLEEEKTEDNGDLNKNLLIRTTIYLSLGVLFFFTTNAMLIKIQHRDDPEMARLKIQWFENPNNPEYKKLFDDYRRENGY